MQPTNTKNVKLHALQNGYLGFSNTLVFYPQKQNFDLKNAQKVIFMNIKKTNIYHRPKSYQHVYKISKNFWIHRQSI